ncbi:MAG: DUF6088 family protein [Prevotella sp.]|jgi:predicted transcriptional regulator of viral defense system|nr:DUF6088 family protein [Prevotella sp.]
MNESIASIVKNRILEKSQGDIVTMRDFDDIQDNNIVRKTLSRLTFEGKINRLASGVYIIPKVTAFGVLMPSLDDIAHSIATKERINIMPTGDTALNILGLSTQVPMKAVYLTDGSRRIYHVGNRDILFKRVTPRNFQFKTRLMTLLNVALKTLGEQNITKETLNRIKEHIKNIDLNERISIIKDLNLSPRWIKELLYPLLKN